MSLYHSPTGRGKASRLGFLLKVSLLAGVPMMLGGANLAAQEADAPSAPQSPPSQPQDPSENAPLPEAEQNNQTDQAQREGQAQREDQPERDASPQRDAQTQRDSQEERPTIGQDNGQDANRDPNKDQDPSRQAWLGVRMDSGPGGVQVLAVQPESAAATAGLQRGDVILRIEETSVRSPQNVIQEIDNKKAGDDISLTVLRNGQQMQLSTTLDSKEEAERRSPSRGESDQRYSMRRVDIDSDSQQRLEMLEQRLEQLEQRLRRFERVVENPNGPASNQAPPQPGTQEPDSSQQPGQRDADDLLPQSDSGNQSPDAPPAD